MALPQSNARVTTVANGGASADYDYDGGADVPVWEGDADGYVSEEKRLVPNGDRLDRISTDYLLLDPTVPIPTEGQFVTFTDDEGEQQTRKILTVAERPKLPAIAPYAKLYLESE